MGRPLKRPKVGLEVEMFILDSEGYPRDDVSRLIKKCRVRDIKYAVRKDYQKDIVEVSAFPRRHVENAALGFLENLEAVIERAEKLGLTLYPCGTYPGMYEPERHKKAWYIMQEKAVGPLYKYAVSRVAGFHLHYCLPRGVLNKENGELRAMLRSRIKQNFLNQFNLSIAMDPALTTFLQSSPYVDGRYIAKDSRMLLYRDMHYKKNGTIDVRGVYHRITPLGGLPPFMWTSNDLNYWLRRQHRHWHRLFDKAGLNADRIMKMKSPLDIARGPIKINKLGTFELRGMDMCKPKYLFGVTMLVKNALDRVEREGLRIRTADRATKTPFKIEGGKVFVPPYAAIAEDLQYKSAIKGFESPEILRYCKRFMQFALKDSPARNAPAMNALKHLVKRKKTVSDKILQKVRNKGYSLRETLPNSVCAEIAISLADNFLKNLDETKANVSYLRG